MSPHRRGSSRTWFLVVLTVVLLVLGGIFTRGRLGHRHADRSPVITLRNGQQLIIEAVAYDTNVVLGRRDWVGERLGRWLPSPLTEWLAPVRGQTHWSSDTPEFTVWLNGYDPAGDRFVDCQGFRLDIVDEAGDLYPALTTGWYGFPKFSRVAHVFPAFPRRSATLQLRVTSYRTNDSYTVTLPNPHRIGDIPAWTANLPPLVRNDDGLEIRLAGFLRKTNGGPDRLWESPSVHWWPRIELRQNEAPTSGWLEPEWWADDPTGNRGQTLGLHEPVQRFHIQAFPSATNAILDSVAAALPTVRLAELGSGLLWSRSATTGPVTFDAIGVLPAGMHLFTGGNLTTNPPPGGPVAPVMGGAPSGWVGIGATISSKHFQSWDGHYTLVPTLYLRAPRFPVTTAWRFGFGTTKAASGLPNRRHRVAGKTCAPSCWCFLQRSAPSRPKWSSSAPALRSSLSKCRHLDGSNAWEGGPQGKLPEQRAHLPSSQVLQRTRDGDAPEGIHTCL